MEEIYTYVLIGEYFVMNRSDGLGVEFSYLFKNLNEYSKFWRCKIEKIDSEFFI